VISAGARRWDELPSPDLSFTIIYRLWPSLPAGRQVPSSYVRLRRTAADKGGEGLGDYGCMTEARGMVAKHRREAAAGELALEDQFSVVMSQEIGILFQAIPQCRQFRQPVDLAHLCLR
jgi:hypothetical protein